MDDPLQEDHTSTHGVFNRSVGVFPDRQPLLVSIAEFRIFMMPGQRRMLPEASEVRPLEPGIRSSWGSCTLIESSMPEMLD